MREQEILREAAEEIETVGWARCQGLAYDENGEIVGLCALAAIYQVSDGVAARKAKELLSKHLEINAGTIWVQEWNDHPGQTAKKVVETLRTVADQG